LDEVPRVLLPTEGARLVRRAAVRDDDVGDVGIGGLVAEHGTSAVFTREIGPDAGVRMIEDLQPGAGRVTLAERGEELLRLGRIRRDGVPRVRLRIGPMEASLDVREAADDVPAADLEDGAAAFFRVGRAGVLQHVLDGRAL